MKITRYYISINYKNVFILTKINRNKYYYDIYQEKLKCYEKYISLAEFSLTEHQIYSTVRTLNEI